MDLLVAASSAGVDSFWLIFTYGVLIPALATGLIVVAIVSARGEKRENEKLKGRWGRQRRSADDA
jgi:hypothetical protein